jgi:hypothetical protein
MPALADIDYVLAKLHWMQFPLSRISAQGLRPPTHRPDGGTAIRSST